MPLNQSTRLLAIKTALGEDVLAVRTFSLHEQISRLFVIEVELSSEDGGIAFDDVVGHDAAIRLEVGESATRYFHGYVSRFTQLANKGGYAHYRATLVPWLWFLTRTADCRIFQEKSVPDIIEEVFKGHGFSDFKLNLSETYKLKEYCVQYRETDFNFVSRLMEQEGIYYFFEHENGKHTLVLADAISAHKAFEGYDEIIFHELEKGAPGREVITDWVIEKEVKPVAFAQNDFDFKKPKTSLLSQTNVPREHGMAEYEIYDYPGEYVEHADGDHLAAVRLDEIQTEHEVVRGNASARGLSAGYTFTLKNHPREDQNRECLVTGVSLQADAGEFASGGDAGGGFFSCSFTAIDSQQQFRAARSSPKPIVQGLQTAIVSGPSGEEIYTDEHGRVKVQFHWDRYGKVDENSSCWVRVSQPWAGKGWGAISIPRIGQEVIVEFLEGDPDRPMITGRVYNASAKVPYELPAEKTKTTLKTNSSKGGQGFNEIRFEDKKGDEQVFIHGEKDQDVRIKNDSREWIGNERHLVVKKDQLELVEGDKHGIVQGDDIVKVVGDAQLTVEANRLSQVVGNDNLTVDGERAEKITGDNSLKVDGNLNEEAAQKISIKAGTDLHGKAGMNYAMDAGMAIHIKGGMTVVIEGGVQVSLKAGPSFVDIGPAGVAISGPMVMINSGGAAGSGGGSSPTAPAAPETPEEPKEAQEADTAEPGEVEEPPPAPEPPPTTSASPAAVVLREASENGTPFCEECERARAAAAAESS